MLVDRQCHSKMLEIYTRHNMFIYHPIQTEFAPGHLTKGVSLQGWNAPVGIKALHQWCTSRIFPQKLWRQTLWFLGNLTSSISRRSSRAEEGANGWCLQGITSGAGSRSGPVDPIQSLFLCPPDISIGNIVPQGNHVRYNQAPLCQYPHILYALVIPIPVGEHLCSPPWT